MLLKKLFVFVHTRNVLGFISVVLVLCGKESDIAKLYLINIPSTRFPQFSSWYALLMVDPSMNVQAYRPNRCSTLEYLHMT